MLKDLWDNWVAIFAIFAFAGLFLALAILASGAR